MPGTSFAFFLDTIGFISDVVSNGVDYAIAQRTPNYFDLVFGGKQEDIELAVEMQIPEQLISDPQFDRIRYEIRIGLTDGTQEHAIKDERVLLLHQSVTQYPKHRQSRLFFPEFFDEDVKISNHNYQTGFMKSVVRKQPGGNDNFYPEIKKNGNKGWTASFKLGTKKSALGNLPADETNFPVASWLKNYLNEGVQLFILDSLNIRKSSPPGQSLKFKTDGSNLPWVIENLKNKYPDSFRGWVRHLQTALPDIQDILVHDLPDIRHKYLKVVYSNGIEVPSWLVSDGTLRLLALTLPAYLPEFEGTYLIEEPENGIHPRAIESVFQSLSSVYNAQILLASHSPVVLSMVQPEQVLCFKKTKEGMTDIVKGNEHPALRGWKHDTNFSILFVSGVLS